MLQVTMIGNLGANAEIKAADGREFVTFRLAHNESYKGDDGIKIDKSMWVDCTMSCTNGRPAVFPYLTKGMTVCVVGSVSTRVYSSAKDKCMKAGLNIHVQKIELIGGQGDSVPKKLYTKNGLMVDVNKYYHSQTDETVLYDQRGNQYAVADGGWLQPLLPNEPADDDGQ